MGGQPLDISISPFAAESVTPPAGSGRCLAQTETSNLTTAAS